MDARFDLSPVAGEPSVLRVTATDAVAPVQGVAVDFGPGEDTVAESACSLSRRGDRRGGGSAEIALDHLFASLAPRTVTVTVHSGRCGEEPVSTTTKLLVTPLGTVPAPTPPGTTPLPLALPWERGAREGRPTAGASKAPSACAGASMRPRKGNLRKARRAVACLVNQIRTSHGLKRLRPRKRLHRAATRHVRDMLRRGYFAHQRSGGPDLGKRLRAARYAYRIAGENLSTGTGQYSTPRSTVSGWWDSAPHRANLLQGRFRHMGIAVRKGYALAKRDDGATYAMALAARR